ncbi:MAG: U32 family peptidase [Deltaproteobacteria bacterium]|nr:U32 family peptidase [Deltaproteobacteria bacterium]
MPALEFSVPYNNDPETLTEIFRLKECNGNRIKEIYLSGPQEYAGSGRISPAQSFDELSNVVKRIHGKGIRVNLLMNSVCEGSDWYSHDILTRTMDYLKRVIDDLGVEAITIANPMYIREVRRNFPLVEICASVLADIDSIDKAIIYKKAGADSFTPDVNINRNLRLLKKIKEKTGFTIKLMVNEGCLFKCPFRKFHFNYIAHKSRNPGADTVRGEENVFSLNCMQVSKNDPSQILKSGWIRPEDLENYGDISSYFKLVGRTSSRSMICRQLEAYMNQLWEGDLLELMAGNLYSCGMSYMMHLDNRSLDAIGFFEKVTSCDHECIDCDFCNQVAARLIKRGFFTNEKVKDIGLL